MDRAAMSQQVREMGKTTPAVAVAVAGMTVRNQRLTVRAEMVVPVWW